MKRLVLCIIAALVFVGIALAQAPLDPPEPTLTKNFDDACDLLVQRRQAQTLIWDIDHGLLAALEANMTEEELFEFGNIRPAFDAEIKKAKKTTEKTDADTNATDTREKLSTAGATKLDEMMIALEE